MVANDAKIVTNLVSKNDANLALPPRIRRVLIESPLLQKKIGNVIEEVADLARQINLEVDRDDIQGLLDSHSQELPMDELLEMHEQEHIEDLESFDPVQSENLMTVGISTEGLSLIEKELRILEN
ncbi:hypothetical protein TNCV_406531 [Trichonephila clavipes]|nr:hypothetical protein TNCV_406531 [Trichonephila clavipes]